MKRKTFVAAGLLVAGLGLAGCSSMGGMEAGWQTLIDGNSGLDNFTRMGDANWRAEACSSTRAAMPSPRTACRRPPSPGRRLPRMKPTFSAVKARLRHECSQIDQSRAQSA